MKTRTKTQKKTVTELVEKLARIYKLNFEKVITYIRCEWNSCSNSMRHFVIMLESDICTNRNKIRNLLQ